MEEPENNSHSNFAKSLGNTTYDKDRKNVPLLHGYRPKAYDHKNPQENLDAIELLDPIDFDIDLG